MSQLDAIKALIVTNFAPDLAAAELPDDYELLTNAVIDSLGVVKLVGLLERQFDLDLDIADLTPGVFRSATTIDEFISGLVPAAAH